MLNRKSKKANLNVLVAVAMGLITLAVLAGIGLTVLAKLGASQAACSVTTCGAAGVYNLSTDVCSNASSSNCGAATGAAYSAVSYAGTQLGSTGLLSWLPAIIALIIGVFFLTYFMGGRKKY